MPEYTTLKKPNVTAGDVGLTTQFRTNICNFTDWSLLSMGYFMNVTLGTVYPYGGNPTTLRLSDDKRYLIGTIWECFKTNLCWENGVEGQYQPIQISGVWVNSNFYPIGTTGQYQFNINYQLGRVVFNSGLPTNTLVQMEYSYKYYNVYPDTVQWFKQLTKTTFRIDDPQFSSYGSGNWSIYPESRAQLPAIVVEPVNTTDWKPLALGGGQWLVQDVLLHVFSENDTDRDSMLDLFRCQNEKKFFLYDINAISRSGGFPLSQYGYLINPSATYPWLISQYVQRFCIIRKSNIQRYQNDPQCVWYGSARWNIDVEFPEI